MTGPLTLGYSPCPNDTFIFYALVHGKINCDDIQFAPPVLEDVETLNSWALKGKLDITKLSCHALGHVLDEYCILSAGSALGRGCGPLLVARENLELATLKKRRIAIPGRYTTAALLLQMLLPGCTELVEMRFDQIMPAILRGEVEAGVIIHESRFTYAQHNLICLQDLGEWWEKDSGLPIPLGAIAARRSLGGKNIGKIERAIRDSVDFAFADPDTCLGYIREHSQEMAQEVVQSHIGLYVNDFSRDLGAEGMAAIEQFLERGRAVGALPAGPANLRYA